MEPNKNFDYFVDDRDIKWNGIYTNGYTYCRGTYVFLNPIAGINSITGESFHQESLDEIIDDIINNFTLRLDLSREFKPVNFDRLKTIIYQNFSDEDYENKLYVDYNDLQCYNDIKKLFTENENVIKHAELILFNNEDFDMTIIYNKQQVVDELNKINQIAKENNVLFMWA